ncbi:hypothetical protein [Jeongeupia chitinilytica]|uniref:Uncharacterized protein n=1 Tax=Jeongeupia chitinilytica TaxID=1041641 RepID=A0ABQ3GYL9_9NEIS|nr:hypothetical protein [Jeongeupia chitinilytica]GHD61599.1 hypothetical protein GCM10007350_16190 [Jeongeupia chitinilytica]
MYDCLEPCTATPARSVPARPRAGTEPSLCLKAPDTRDDAELLRARAVAEDLGYPARRDGARLYIRGIDVHLALRLQALFPTLIACYEVPTRYRCTRR